MIPTNTADVAPRAAPSTLVSGFHFAAFPDAGVPGEGYWRRAFARIIDLILLELVEWIALVIVAAPTVAFAARMGTPGELLLERLGRTTLASTVLGMAGLVAYFTLFEWLWGSTPGKRLLGLVVVTEDLAPCPAGAALTRNVLWLVEMLAASIPAYLAIRNSARAQRHGDRWAGTIVSRRRDLPATPPWRPMRLLLSAACAMAAISLTVAVTVLASAFPVPPSPGDFKVGQVWRYKARPGEETSLAYIAWVDHQQGVSIYHLYLDGLRLRNPRLPGGIQPALPHVPVAEAALRQSVTTLVQEDGPVPDISEAYDAWRQAWDAGQAGVFTIPLAEIVGVAEGAAAGAR